MGSATPVADGAALATTYFDGLSNRKHVVALRFGAQAIDILEDGLGLASWRYDDMRRASDTPTALRFSATSALPLARLEVRDPALQREILSRCRALGSNPSSAPRQTARIVAWSLGAIVSLVLVVIYGMPLLAERLAPLIPASFERRLGDVAERQAKLMFGGNTCTRADGKAAFDKLIAALKDAGGLHIDLQAEVTSSSITNAFALPGGKVYLLDPLLQQAQNVDELAGVLAHELGHIVHRDHMRTMIYNGGTSFLIGLLFGDVTGSSAAIFATRSLLTSSYSREAESNADQFAVTVMHKLGRSPRPLGEFLVRLTKKQNDASSNRNITNILASHPMSDERLKVMSAAHREPTGPELLAPAEWRALKGICRQ
jgi:Zn-dependent protease with chaperone function